MSIWLQLTNGLRVLMRRKRADGELDEETRHFFDETMASLQANGLSAEEAARIARLQCGSSLAIREQVREAGWESWIADVLSDFRIAARRLARTPGFTVAAAATLALGIGATAAIFSIVDAVLLRPLPYRDSGRLVALIHAAPGIDLKVLNMAPSLYYTYKEESRAFDNVALWHGRRATVTGFAEPQEELTLSVTYEFLRVLDVAPQLGRGFTASDGDPANPRAVILSDGYWRSRFAGSPDALGRSITIDGNPHRVIGVLPRSFEFMDENMSLVVPKQLRRAEVRLIDFGEEGVARMRRDVTLAQANADVARCLPLAIAKFASRQAADSRGFTGARIRSNLQPLKAQLVGDLGGTLWVLMSSVFLLLLTACANVANLFLVRADGRRRETAVRTALGAAWSRIAREFLVESCLLGATGGAFGLLFCAGMLRVLKSLSFVNLPRLQSIGINGLTLLFTLAAALVVSVLFGLAPLWQNAGFAAADAMRTGAGRTASAGREEGRFRAVLVAVQVGLAAVLLVGSLLMIRTFQALRHVDPGFTRPQTVQAVRISIPAAQAAEPARVLAMQEEIYRRFEAVLGVSHVAATSSLPLEGGSNNPVLAKGRQYPADALPPTRRMRFVSPGFSAALGKPIVAGRDFYWSELEKSAPVTMISENLARELWQSPQAAIGKRIRHFDRNHRWHEVIGVVVDIRDEGLSRPAPATVYWPLLQKLADGSPTFPRNLDYLIRSERAGSNAFIKELQLALKAVNPNLPLANVRTLEKPYKRSLARTSLAMSLLGAAGAMALALGVIGIYGVLSYAVALRTRDIGIRIALGCPASGIARLFLRQGLMLAIAGSLCGIAAAALLTRLMRTLLFGINPLDVPSFGAVLLCLLLAALGASWLPARRAASVDPAEALRAE